VVATFTTATEASSRAFHGQVEQRAGTSRRRAVRAGWRSSATLTPSWRSHDAKREARPYLRQIQMPPLSLRDRSAGTVTLPKPMTSSAKAEGRFGKEDFVYLAEENVYGCPASEKLHEDLLEAVQKRLDENPHAMRTRRETSEHPFGTIKVRISATHFLMKTLPKVVTEMALCVLISPII
jgi:hypothetical protein